MRILFCGETFPKTSVILRKLLPTDEVLNCRNDRVLEFSRKADVLIPLMFRIDPNIIAATSARMIHQWGVGLEGVDIPAATEKGIWVCNVPGDLTLNADSTAEHALFLMLGLARDYNKCKQIFYTGPWGEPPGLALHGRRALIVGMGKVGKALARKLSAMGMDVAAIRRTPELAFEQELGIREVGSLSDLSQMAQNTDFVISTISLSDETRGVFSTEFFNSIKQSAYFINVSRGPVVDESALISALANKQIAGAGLDVFTVEPLDPANPLLKMPNVMATPHVAGATIQNYEGISKILAANIELFREGKKPPTCVN